MRGWWALVAALAVALPGALPAQEPEPPPPPPAEIPALLAAGGESAGLAKVGILHRVGELPEPRATRWVQLYALVGTASPGGSALAASGLLEAEEEREREGAGAIVEGIEGLPDEDRLPLLAFAALLLERADPDEAARLRERFVEESPEVGEGPPQGYEVRVRLARRLIETGGSRDRAAGLLEAVILAAPNHPVTPEARRLLAGLRSDRR